MLNARLLKTARSCTASIVAAARAGRRAPAADLKALWPLLHDAAPDVAAETPFALPDLPEEPLRALGELFSLADLSSTSRALELSVATRPEGGDFTFGEVPPQSLHALLLRLRQLGLRSGGRFVDLGSGTGTPVLSAAALHGFERCSGIEVLRELHARAQSRLTDFSFVPADGSAAAVDFVCNDARKEEWSDASVVLLNSTAFSAELLADLSEAAINLAPGAFVVSLTQRLPCPALDLVAQLQLSANGTQMLGLAEMEVDAVDGEAEPEMNTTVYIAQKVDGDGVAGGAASGGAARIADAAAALSDSDVHAHLREEEGLLEAVVAAARGKGGEGSVHANMVLAAAGTSEPCARRCVELGAVEALAQWASSDNDTALRASSGLALRALASAGPCGRHGLTYAASELSALLRDPVPALAAAAADACGEAATDRAAATLLQAYGARQGLEALQGGEDATAQEAAKEALRVLDRWKEL